MDDWGAFQSSWGEPPEAADHSACLPARAGDPLSDDVLMFAVGKGDADAFAQLVERHLPSVYRLSYRLLGGGHDAEDIAQESFARLWQGAPNWRPVGAGLPGWLARVATNLCLDRLRRPRILTAENLPESPDDTPDALRRLQTDRLAYTVERCLADLSPRHRAALVLSYYEDIGSAPAAQIMDMHLKAYESLLLRARRRMRALLAEAGVLADDLALLS